MKLGSDYLIPVGAVSFLSSSSTWLPFQPFDNPVWTGTRSLKLRLTDPGKDVVLGPNSTATVMITDDDTVFGPFRGMNGLIWTVSAAPDSKWLIGGDFAFADGFRRAHLARLERDGTVDPTFDPGLGATGPVYASLFLPERKLLVGGAFTSFGGTTRALLVRLTDTGELDPTFEPNLSPASVPGSVDPSSVRNLLSLPDGSIRVAGRALNCGSLTNVGVLRLRPEGVLDPKFVPPSDLTNATIFGEAT